MQKIVLGLIGAIVLTLIVVIASHINKVPTLDESVKAAWAQVDNQYKRRADLIPNLVATVKGYASHEKEVLTQVVEARSKVSQVQLSPQMLNDPNAFAMFEKSQGALSSALSRLMVVVERYPELKADKNFQALQSQLEGTENRISVARKDYIAAVQKYNIELRTFPGKWVASIFHPEASVKENFSATPQEQAVPKVEF